MSTTTTNSTTSAAQQRLQSNPGYYWFIVVYMVAISALGSFVNDMYSPALPEMCSYFGCSVSTSQLGLTMGMCGLAIGQFILGPVSDRYGRRPVLIGSVSLFILADIASIFSPTITVFNTLRLLQGMGASGAYFLGRTIPADIYSGRQLAKLMALIGAINGVAPASSPVIGGLLAQHWGWHAVFIFLAAYAAIVLALSPRMLESLAPAHRTTTPWWRNFGGYRILLKNRAYLTHVSLKGTSLGYLFAYISATPFIFQNQYGLTQTQYGLLIGFNALFMAGGAMLAIRFRPLKRAALIGAAIVLLTTGAAIILLCTGHHFWLLEGTMMVIALGLGLIFTPANTLAMNEGRARAGEASAILGISGYAAGAIVCPLVGIGNIAHSSAITFGILAIIVMLLAIASNRLPCDLNS